MLTLKLFGMVLDIIDFFFFLNAFSLQREAGFGLVNESEKKP